MLENLTKAIPKGAPFPSETGSILIPVIVPVYFGLTDISIVWVHHPPPLVHVKVTVLLVVIVFLSGLEIYLPSVLVFWFQC